MAKYHYQIISGQRAKIDSTKEFANFEVKQVSQVMENGRIRFPKQQKSKGKIKFNCYVFNYIFSDVIVYIPIILYLIVFLLLSFNEDTENVFCMFFALASAITTGLDIYLQHKAFTPTQKNMIIVITWVILLVFILFLYSFVSGRIRNSMSNLISGGLLIAQFFLKAFVAGRTAYKRLIS